MNTGAQSLSAAAMPHATEYPPVHNRPPSATTAPARRPAPIQTTNLHDDYPSQPRALPDEQIETDESILERPPISPITPTDEDGPASLSMDSFGLPHATHSQDGTLDSRPLSRTSFTFTAPRHASTPPRPHSERSASQSALVNGFSDSNSATPPRPPSSASQPSYHFATAGGMHPQPPSNRVAHTNVPPATFMPQPAAQPLDEASNTDVAALQACISVLQLQQAKSRKDIATLQRLKDRAAADPAGFADALQSGRMNDGAAASDPLAATFAGADEDSDADDDDGAASASQRPQSTGDNKFGTLPQPQNVVRCPPINWAKYHIVGEPLDRMHEEQRRRPDPGEPWRDGPRDAVVFAPYSPFKDQVGSPQPQQPGMVTRKGGKRPG